MPPNLYLPETDTPDTEETELISIRVQHTLYALLGIGRAWIDILTKENAASHSDPDPKSIRAEKRVRAHYERIATTILNRVTPPTQATSEQSAPSACHDMTPRYWN